MVFSVTGIWLSLGSFPYPWWIAVPTQGVGLLLLAAGLFVWIRHPEGNRMAWLLVATGITRYIGDLQFSKNPALFRLGFWLFYLNGSILMHLLLAFPDGRLARRSERMTVVAGYVANLVTQGLRLLTEKLTPQIWGERHPSVWGPVGSVSGAVLTVVALVLVAQRWKAEPGPVRRSRGVYWAAVALIGLVAMSMMAAALARTSTRVEGTLMMLHAVAILLLGVAVLVGSLRTQMAHQRVSRFLARLKPESAGDRSLRDALAEALEDSSLTLHYRRPDSGEYVDA